MNSLNYITIGQMSIEEGLRYISDVSKPMYWELERVRRDRERFRVIINAAEKCALKCSCCGAEATHFAVRRHRRDKVSPFGVDLFAGTKMMTWDHIIPRSFSGSHRPENSRLACESCNHDRGNVMTLSELLWVNSQDPLLVYRTVNTAPAPMSKLIIMARALGAGMELPDFSDPVAVTKTLKYAQAKNALKRATKGNKHGSQISS